MKEDLYKINKYLYKKINNQYGGSSTKIYIDKIKYYLYFRLSIFKTIYIFIFKKCIFL